MFSTRSMTGSRVGRPAAWVGRILLPGAVAFWWGAIVVPRLVSLALPDLLPPDAIPRDLDPDEELTAANAVSAAALLTVGLLALANALRSLGKLRTGDERIAALGWTTLAVTGAYLAWDELSEFHVRGTRDLGDAVLGSSNLPWFWPVVLSPAIAAFVVAMAVFIYKGLRVREVRAPLVLGLAAWLLAILYEVSYPSISRIGGGSLAALIEETLEFVGALLLGLSAAQALGQAQEEGRGAAAAEYAGRRLKRLAVGSIVVVMALAVLATLAYRGPLSDARARTHVGTFNLSLRESNESSLVQELGELAAPVSRIGLRVANHDPEDRSGAMLWRLMEAGEGISGRVIHEGRIEVPVGEHPSWRHIDFPALAYDEGRRLMVQLVADVEPEAELLVRATKTNRFPDGRLWINGEPAWPDQNIEFAVYMAAKPTLGKLRTMWTMFTSDWGWPLLAAEAAIGMTVVVFATALLVSAALRRRGWPW